MPKSAGTTNSMETHDVASLRRIIATVRDLLAPAIRLVGDPDSPKSTGAMQKAGVKQLDIPFVLALERAMGELGRWGRGCESAWAQQLIRESAAKAGSKAVKKAKIAKKKR